MSISPQARHVSIEDVREAHDRIRDKVHRTPVLTSRRLNEQCRAELFFKCENFQNAGAFKARGATNAVFALSESQAARGVATHSSGNHGAALARAARLRGIAAHIVMPSNAPATKQAAVRGYGGRIVFCEPTPAAREAACARLIQETGATLVHPHDDPLVIAGQGTAAVELLEDIPDLDFLLAPVGGGGLLSGTAVAAKAIDAGIRVIGAEPAQADDAYQSLRKGERVATVANTIADGLRTWLGERNFALIRANVDDIVTVSEEGIVSGMRRIWEVLKIVIEPSAAVPFGAILERALPVSGRRAGIILSGGNVDLESLPWT